MNELKEQIAKTRCKLHCEAWDKSTEKCKDGYDPICEGGIYYTNQILFLVRKEVEKALLTDEEARKAEAMHAIGSTTLENESRRALIAQVQLDKVLKILE